MSIFGTFHPVGFAIGGGATAPGQPTLTRLANDLTGTSFTATVAPHAGSPSDPVHVVYHAHGGTPASGGSRTGSGTVQVAGLSANTWYYVEPVACAAADSDARSLPGEGQWVMVHDGTNLLASAREAVVAALRASANLAACAPDGNWAKADSRGHVFHRILDAWVGGRSPGRAPFIEVDFAEHVVPRRLRGDQLGAQAAGTLRIRLTARERDDIHGLARDVALCLQSDSHRSLGDAAHVLSFDLRVGPVARRHPIQRMTLEMDIRFFVQQGTTI